MSIFNWLRRGKRDERSLIRINSESPRLAKVEEAAAEDVARVEQDDKYFEKDSPANDDDL